MAENPLKKIVRWSLWGTGAVAAVAVGLHFLLPLVLNTPVVKGKVLRMAGLAIPGRFEIDALRPRLFPLPSIAFSDVRYTLPDTLNLDADTIIFYPKIAPLLIGRLRPDAVIIQSPTVSLELPRSRTHAAEAPLWLGPPFDHEQAREVLAAIPQGCRLYVNEGQMILHRGPTPTPAVRLYGIDARIAEADDGLSLTIEGRANLADDFEVDARLDRRTLDGKGRIALTGFKADVLEEIFASGPADLRLQAMADLSLNFEIEGMRTCRAAFTCAAPLIRLQKDDRRIDAENFFAEGTVRLTPQRLQATLSRLQSTTPKVSLSGALIWDRTQPSGDAPALQLSIQAYDTDMTRLRGDLLSFFPELHSWPLFNVVQGGTLVSMTLNSSGSSWAQMGRLETMTIAGRAAAGSIFVPGVALNLKEVSGDWQLEKGVLSTRGAAARVGDTRAYAGVLKLDLTQKPLPIDLDMELEADLAQLPPVLKRMISDPAIQTELDHLKALQGTASGRLTLNGHRDRLAVAVTATDISLEAGYDRLPDPIGIKGGQFTYAGGHIAVSDVYVVMGDTTVDGLEGQIFWQDPARISLQGRSARLACDRLYPWILSAFPGVAEKSRRVETLSGTLALETFRLNGPLDDPRQWQFDCSGRVERIKAAVQPLPNEIALQTGTFKAWLANGQLGLEGDFGLPENLAVSASLTVAAHDVDLQKLILTDANSSAAVTLHHDGARKSLDLSFSGHLEGTTLDKLWPQDAAQRWIKGEMTAHVDLDRPSRSSMNGQLAAAGWPLPLPSIGSFYVHRADLEAHGKALDIAALDLIFADQQFSLSGKSRFGRDTIELDLRLASEALDLDRLIKAYRQTRKKQPANSSGTPTLPGLRGVIDARIDRLTHDGRIWDEVLATVTLQENQATVDLKQGNLCGISATGQLRFTSEGIAIEVEPKARKQTLQFAIGCLGGAETTERIEGTFDVAGRLTASGQTTEEIIPRLQGVMELNVYDGRIVNVGRAGLFTNLLTYLTVNNLVTGDLPDMRERDFKYNRIDMQMFFKDNLIELNSADMLADALNMVAAGTMDMETRQLDLDVLVSPLTSVDAVVRNIPLVGDILQGTLIAIPVGVVGPLHDPTVIPLSPKAIGSRLTGILGGILKAPFKLVEPIFPSSNVEEQGPGDGPKSPNASDPSPAP